MKISVLVCILAALVMELEVLEAETNLEPRVEALREFDRFVFHGNQSFSTTNLWTSLNASYDFPELSHPLAPCDEFLRGIENYLQLGYLHCGFPDAHLTACCNSAASRVIVDIEEGPRYQCGGVEVIGAQSVPVSAIVDVLTVSNANPNAQPCPYPFQFLDSAPANRSAAPEENDSIIWSAGQPACFDDITLGSLSNLVTGVLHEQGFYQSRFNLNIATNAAKRTATLQVKMIFEGPQAVVDSIEVSGNRRNSREQLMDFLKLKSGMPFTAGLVAAINDRIYHSGRFLTNSVVAGPPDTSGRVKLTLQVVEDDSCPPLNAEFSPVEKTMLKARDWFSKLGENQDEMILSAPGYSGEKTTTQCIISPQQGIILLENEAVFGTNRLRHALVMTADQIALYVPRQREKYLMRISTGQFGSSLLMETGAPDENGHCGDLSFGVALKDRGSVTSAPPCSMSVSLAPAVCLRFAHQTNAAYWYDGGQLIVSNVSSVLRLDLQTGRLIELTFNDKEHPGQQVRLCFERGAFAPALARIEQNGAGFVNVCNTNNPFGSAIGFFGSELVQLPFVETFLQSRLPPDVITRLPFLLHRLSEGTQFSGLLDYLDFSPSTNDPVHDFVIPETPHPEGGTLCMLSRVILTESDLILPPRSWPWTVMREAGFSLRSQQNYLMPDLVEIYNSDETGPLGYLTVSLLLEKMKLPQARLLARQGLQHLSAKAFRNDCYVLLDEHYAAGQLTARILRTLGDLDQPDLDILLKGLRPARAEFIRDCIRRMRSAPKDQPLFETLAPALDAVWDKDLKQDIGNRLQSIADK